MIKVSEKHPHLFHYTTWEGLKGIVESNTLFATHARFLNDSSELYQAAEPLIQLLMPSVGKLIDCISQKELVQSEIIRYGGLDQYSYNLTHHCVDSFYRLAGPDFYICSFFGTSDKPYIEKNGLLSQWRGYGGEQGFAIEFETSKLELLTELEGKSYGHFFGAFADVVYGKEHALFSEDFLPHFKKFELFVLAKLRKEFGEDIDLPSGFAPFCYCASMLKHVGFEEEHEVRIVAAPLPNRDDVEKIKALLDWKDIVPKSVHSRVRNSIPVPYIKLFDFGHEGLPITRIIVGPSKDKENVAFAVRKLFGSKFPIEVCETPFV